MTIREQLCEIGVNWTDWTVWSEDVEVRPSERWLDHWLVVHVWTNISPGFHLQAAANDRLVTVSEPGINGRRWAILVTTPGLEAFIS